MALKFNQNEEGAWVAEFEVAQEFNIHIEVDDNETYIYQTTVKGRAYDLVNGVAMAAIDGVIDVDMGGLIYPKWIKVVSKVEPTYAEVTLADGSTISNDDNAPQ